MQGSIFEWWQAIVGLIAIVGVWIAWRQWRKPSTRTENLVERGDRNTQTGGPGATKNTIKDGDDNRQGG